jgi:hypothetical protein
MNTTVNLHCVDRICSWMAYVSYKFFLFFFCEFGFICYCTNIALMIVSFRTHVPVCMHVNVYIFVSYLHFYNVPLLASNRAAAFLQLVKLNKALADAETTISLKPQWEKVHVNVYLWSVVLDVLISSWNSNILMHL